jgi:arylsulfate sulfotransferase
METQISPKKIPSRKQKLPFSVLIIIAFVAVMAVLSIVLIAQAYSRRNDVTTKAITDNGKTVLANGNFDQMSSQVTTSAVKKMIQKVYTASYSSSVKQNLEQLKKKNVYSLLRPLIVHNPYGTNTTSLYAYFQTDEAVKVSYTVHAAGVKDYTKTAEKNYKKTHEFTILGLTPNTINTVTITTTNKKGQTATRTVKYKMGSLLAGEAVNLQKTVSNTSSQKLSNGLYAILGNDSDGIDYVSYYDNDGHLRGEIPIIGYRAHRLLFKNGLMYYSISQTKIAAVDDLGQVHQIISTGQYILHHDYVFDKDGNLVTLASLKTNSYSTSRSEDLILRIDTKTGKIINVVDLGDILGDYKKTTKRPASATNLEGVYGLDWMHINTIQYLGGETYVLSSRETSTIIKISNLFESSPNLDYLIGPKSLWKGTAYSSKVLKKIGKFVIQTGQHSVTYQKTSKAGVYRIYLFDNNFGISQTNPSYNWGKYAGVQVKNNLIMSTKEIRQASSYYYEYEVNENKGTYKLIKKIAVPYSSHVSSVQKKDGNIIVDSGFQGLIGEYSKSGRLIQQFKVAPNKYMVYRVYKYDFNGFYFNK